MWVVFFFLPSEDTDLTEGQSFAGVQKKKKDEKVLSHPRCGGCVEVEGWGGGFMKPPHGTQQGGRRSGEEKTDGGQPGKRVDGAQPQQDCFLKTRRSKSAKKWILPAAAR